jgi:hypothetical protein
MSSKDNSEEYDPDFDEDDEEIRKIQLQMRAKASQPSNQAYTAPKQVRPDHRVLSGIVQTFQNTPGEKCILDYVKSGSEINQALRSGDSTYRETVICLDKYAKPLKELIVGNFDYIVLYRNMTSSYESGKSSGFISTANVPLPGFGRTTRMKIYAPMNVKVLVADITKLVKNPRSSSSNDLLSYDNVFEFILPRGITLNLVDRDSNGVDYYTISSGNEELDNRIRKQILSDLLITQT